MASDRQKVQQSGGKNAAGKKPAVDQHSMPSQLPAAPFLWMQQLLGNQAVQRMHVRNDETGLDKPDEEEEETLGKQEPSGSFHEISPSLPQQNGTPQAQAMPSRSYADSAQPTGPSGRAPQASIPEHLGTDTGMADRSVGFSTLATAAIGGEVSRPPVPDSMATSSDSPSQTMASSFTPSAAVGDGAFRTPISDRVGASSDVPNQTALPSHSAMATSADGVSQTPVLDTPTTTTPATMQSPSSELVVDDSAAKVEHGQMKKSDFLAELHVAVLKTADQELAGTLWSAEGCPWIDYWFAYYNNQEAQHVERAIHKYAPETAYARMASDYIPVVSERVRQAMGVWARTGKITGVPDGIPMHLPGSTRGEPSRLVPGDMFFKSREGGARKEGDPRQIQAQLGAGHPLDSRVKTSMESAYGANLSHVRVHTDTNAAGLSGRLNARAFTVGEHIAFGSGEYQPGTPIGDALIAHELAHVVQQHDSGSASAVTDHGENSGMETDADRAAIGAVSSIWLRGQGAFKRLAQNAMPRLRSGLSLQRCARSKFPSYSEIVADTDVQTKVNAAWASTEAAATAVGRREEGFWIRLNTGTKKFEFTSTTLGPTVGPAATGSVILGARPADTPNPSGTIYTVASFHTHTPTAFRPVGRAVGPSAADHSADTSDDVTGVVYDYVESSSGSGAIPAGHPIGSAAQTYQSGPNSRQKE
jgi:hypothetical protein